MGCDYFANGDEDLVIIITDYRTGRTLARFTIPKHKLEKDMPLGFNVLGAVSR